MTTSTKVLWRVQVKAKTGNWINKGLFETRDAARHEAGCLRDGYAGPAGRVDGLGFGNTRIQRYVRGEK